MRTRRKQGAKRRSKLPPADKKKAPPRPFLPKRKPAPPCSPALPWRGCLRGAGCFSAAGQKVAVGHFLRACGAADGGLAVGRGVGGRQHVWFWRAKGMVSGGKTIRFGGQKVTFRGRRAVAADGGAFDAGRGDCRWGAVGCAAARGKGRAVAARAGGKHSAAPPALAGGRGGVALWPRRRGCKQGCRRGAGGLPDLGALALGQEELVALLHLERVIPSVDVRQGGVHACLVGRVGVGGDDHVHILGAHVRSPHACP